MLVTWPFASCAIINLFSGQRRDRIKQNVGRLNFDYVTPSPHFNRAKVRGLAATLITLEKGNYKASTALEIAAGGKLYQVVVEDEKTGSELLKHGQLRKRVTLIPLNKVNSFTLSAQVCISTIVFWVYD